MLNRIIKEIEKALEETSEEENDAYNSEDWIGYDQSYGCITGLKWALSIIKKEQEKEKGDNEW